MSFYLFTDVFSKQLPDLRMKRHRNEDQDTRFDEIIIIQMRIWVYKQSDNYYAVIN